MLIDRLGRALFWGIAFLLVYLSMRFAVVGIETSSPGMVYHLTERKMALYMHIVFASLAMLLLPFQFWKGLRRSRPDIHRMLGRFCFAGIILGGTAGGIVGFSRPNAMAP